MGTLPVRLFTWRSVSWLRVALGQVAAAECAVTAATKWVRGGPRNSDSLLRWDPDQGEGVWHATEETELSG